MYELILGDCLDKLKGLEDNSVDAVVTDPPYGINFMGKKWDYQIPSKEVWEECLRVLKPGAHMLVFCGTKTQHRMVVNIEDAGFEVRDIINWVYGSGFPKSLNIGKGIDKKLGNEREVVGKRVQRVDGTLRNQKTNGGFMKENISTEKYDGYVNIEKPSSKEAELFEGWGTGLKPSHELITLVRKPLSEKTIVDNVLLHGTGGLNIDDCRVEAKDQSVLDAAVKRMTGNKSIGEFVSGINIVIPNSSLGRFPANLIHDGSDEVLKEFEKEGYSKSVGGTGSVKSEDKIFKLKEHNDYFNYKDEGTPARFFTDVSSFIYQTKPSTKERNLGLDGFEETLHKPTGSQYETKYCIDCGLTYNGTNNHSECSGERIKENITNKPSKNNHPTLKSVSLMNYLCRLITPPGGIVLDPFMGSGSTGIGALLNDFSFIGIELDEDYLNIADGRIKNYELYRQFLKIK